MKKIILFLIIVLLNCDLFKPSNDESSSTSTTDNSDTTSVLANATPINLGDTLSIKLYYETYSYYKLVIDESILLHVKTSGMPSLVSPNIHLLDKDGDGILGYTHYGNGQNFDTYFSMTAGEYYFAIYPDRGDSSSESFDISFLKDAIDTMEYNNTLSSAKPINVDTEYHGTIIPIKDVDCFSFSLDKSQIIRLKVDSIPSDIRLNVRIYDEGDSCIYAYFKSFEVESLVLDYPLAKGDYYLGFKANDQYQSSNQPYYFKLTEYTVDAFEGNNDFASSKEILIGDTITGNIYPQGDEDYFKFTIEDSSSITMFADSVPSGIDFVISLYDGAENFIEFVAGEPGDTVSFSEDLSPGSYYVILLDRWNNATSEMLYRFSVNKN